MEKFPHNHVYYDQNTNYHLIFEEYKLFHFPITKEKEKKFQFNFNL